jgi:transposase
MNDNNRRYFSPEQKVAILREHLIEGKAVSDLCDKHHIHPTVFYQWQRQFFENGAATFESKQSRSRAVLAVGFTDMRKAEGIPLVHCQAEEVKHELGLRPVATSATSASTICPSWPRTRIPVSLSLISSSATC